MRRPVDEPVRITGDRASHAEYGIGPATDYACPIGTPVRAPFSGQMGTYQTSLGGLGVIVEGADATFYGQHLSDRYAPGSYGEGDEIALSGNTGGLTTGPHLHCYVIVHATGARLSMEEYFATASPAGGDSHPINPVPTPEEETPMNVMLVLYVPTNALILVDHLNRTMRNLGNDPYDQVRDYYSHKPLIVAYDQGDDRRNIAAGDVYWQDLIKAGTDLEYRYL